MKDQQEPDLNRMQEIKDQIEKVISNLGVGTNAFTVLGALGVNTQSVIFGIASGDDQRICFDWYMKMLQSQIGDQLPDREPLN